MEIEISPLRFAPVERTSGVRRLAEMTIEDWASVERRTEMLCLVRLRSEFWEGTG